MKSKRAQAACVGWAVAFLATAALGQNKMVIGLVRPQIQPGQSSAGGDIGEPVRQSLASQLQDAGFEVVPLASREGPEVDAEAAARHATYVLYTRVAQKHAGGMAGIGGMLRNLSPLASALPFVGAHGGGLAGAAASTLAQSAAGAAAAAAQQTAMAQMVGGQQSPPTQQAMAGMRSGDTISVDYRLMAPGSNAPLAAATVRGDARSDGDDVLGPLMGQLARHIAAVTHAEPGATGGASAPAATPTTFQSTDGRADSADAPVAKHSMLGGLFGHRDAAPGKTAANAGGGAMDCAKLATMPNAMMTLESCQQLQAQQQAYTSAASDPRAVHPGDEQMSCAQITAELYQQPVTAPDKARVVALQTSADKQMKMVRREEADVAKQQAQDQAAVDAASAADRATELASGGLVRGRALQTAEKAIDERRKATNEQIDRESAPLERKTVGNLADLGGDLTQQLQANPRMARLLQLAEARHCKGG